MMPNSQPAFISQQTIVNKKSSWVRHPIRNSISLLITLLVILVVIFFLTSFVFLGLWLRTWSVFTQERTIGYITVSPLMSDAECKTYFKLKFEGKDVEAAFGRLFPWGEKEIKIESFTVDKMYGDTFTVFTPYFKWKDWLTFLGTPPLYKITSIRSTYYNENDYNKYAKCTQAIPVNGGTDKFWQDIVENKSFWNFGAQAYFITNPGQKATDKERKFEIRITEDGAILKEVNL